MAGCGVINERWEVSSTAPVWAAGTICDFAIYVDPTNSANITVNVNGVGAKDWFPGMAFSFKGVDLGAFSFSGSAGCYVNVVGQSAPVR